MKVTVKLFMLDIGAIWVIILWRQNPFLKFTVLKGSIITFSS